MKKKWISLLTAFALLLGVFCFLPADKVWADDEYTAWESTTDLPTINGNYILTGNVVLSSSKTISNITIKIDLNGYNITMTSTKPKENIYRLGSGAVLTIKDSSADESGYITGRKEEDGQGGIFYLEKNSKLYLESGTLKDSFAGDGGAVHVSPGAEFHMSGGTIKDCTCTTGGGGVHNKGLFEMSGGLITGCYSKSGGGGAQTKETGSVIRMTGGEISGNSAKALGGGIRMISGTIELSGTALITNNMCKHDGVAANTSGDRHAAGAGIVINGGTIKVQGNPQVFGNDSDYAPGDPRDNIYLASGGKIKVVGELGPDAKLAVSRYPADISTAITDGLNGKGTAAAFISDNDEYEVVTDSNGEAILSKIETMFIKSCNVSSDGDIKLNVYLGIDESYQSDAEASYSYSYTVTKNGQNKTENRSGSFTFDQMTEEDGLYKFSIPVESACMTAPIEITATSGDLSITKTITIEKYANAIINGKDYTASQKAAAEALIKYGGYAQVQFSINANKLPQGYDFTAEPSSSLTSEEFTKPDTLYGASVVFLTQNSIKFYFTEDVGTVTVNGTSVSGVQSGNYYVYEYKGADGNGIPAGDFDASYTVVAGSTSFDYSIYTYLKAIYASKGSGSMVNLAKAYYNFATAIKAL